MAQLGEGLGLDLADALAGHAEAAPDLLERAGPAVVEPEPQTHDLLLPLHARARVQAAPLLLELLEAPLADVEVVLIGRRL